MATATSQKNWIDSQIAGMPLFARIPAQVLLDARLGASELRVLLALALHADTAGRCSVSQARVAEICGFSLTTKVDGKQSSPYVCAVIKKLVLLGYVKKSDARYKAISRYQLCLAEFSAADLRQVTNRHDDGYVKADYETDALAQEAAAAGFLSVEEYAAGDFAEITTPAGGAGHDFVHVHTEPAHNRGHQFNGSADDYTYQDCLDAITLYIEGFEKEIPAHILARFNLKYPASRSF